MDYYEVVSRSTRGTRKKYAKQTIKDGLDSMVVDLSTFRHFCDEGVPQALEALFAPEPEVDLLTDFRNSYRVNTANVVRTYKRTIYNFAEGDYKRRRHGLRLALNLREMLRTGRFNPRLPREHQMFVGTCAALVQEDYLTVLERTMEP